MRHSFFTRRAHVHVCSWCVYTPLYLRPRSAANSFLRRQKSGFERDDPRARANAGHFALRHLPPHRYPKSKLTLNPNQLRKLKITVILTLNFADFAVAIPNVSFLFTHNFQRNPKALNITHNPNGKN